MAKIVANDPIVKEEPAIMQELDVEEHPVQDPLFAPQQPYAGAAAGQQGMLLQGGSLKTVGTRNDDELLCVVVSLNAKYKNVVANQGEHSETAVSLLKELAEDVLRWRILSASWPVSYQKAGSPW